MKVRPTCSRVNESPGTLYNLMMGLLGSLTRRYLPSSRFRHRSTRARTIPQQLSMFRLICWAKSLDLHTCSSQHLKSVYVAPCSTE